MVRVRVALAAAALVALCAAPLQAQQLAPGEGSWKRVKESKEARDQEYYILRASDDGKLRGKRVPAYPELDTKIVAEVSDGQLRGGISYIDTVEGGLAGDVAYAPVAQWELALSDDTLSGRWEQLDVDFGAKTADKLVLGREWVDRELRRLPRIGGHREYLLETPAPSGLDLSSLAARAFEGLYVDEDGQLARVVASGKDLTLTLGEATYQLTTGRPRLVGALDGAATPCEIELSVEGNDLVGRVAWKDYDAAADTVVQQGFSPIRLERLIHTGPPAVDGAAPEAPPASEIDLEALATSTYSFQNREVAVSREAEALLLTLPRIPLSPLRPEGGILVAEEARGPVQLRWELAVADDALVGRRQWILHRKDQGEAVETGWVAVKIDRARPVPVEPEMPVVEEPVVEEPVVEEPAVVPAPAPVLSGWTLEAIGAGEASDDAALAAVEGEPSAPAGTWKVGAGRYLVVDESGEGTLRWDGETYEVALQLEGEDIQGTWQADDDGPQLRLRMARPSAGASVLKLQWVKVGADGAVVEEGWVQLPLKRLRRLG